MWFVLVVCCCWCFCSNHFWMDWRVAWRIPRLFALFQLLFGLERLSVSSSTAAQTPGEPMALESHPQTQLTSQEDAQWHPLESLEQECVFYFLHVFLPKQRKKKTTTTWSWASRLLVGYRSGSIPSPLRYPVTIAGATCSFKTVRTLGTELAGRWTVEVETCDSLDFLGERLRTFWKIFLNFNSVHVRGTLREGWSGISMWAKVSLEAVSPARNLDEAAENDIEGLHLLLSPHASCKTNE